MYDDKHMLKVVRHATASAFEQPRGNRYLPTTPKLDGKQHHRFSQNLYRQQECLHCSLKILKDKSALHATPVPAKQNTTPARSNMGHTQHSSLEQSSQGATYYKQPVLVR